MLKNCYWNNSGKHQECLDAINKLTPDIGYTGNSYLDAFLAAQHLYYDAYNNGGGNIEDCYLPAVRRYIHPLFPSFDAGVFIRCEHAAMEKAFDKIIELIASKDLRFRSWGVDVFEGIKYVLYDPDDGNYKPCGEYSVIFGDILERDNWLKARLSWGSEKNTVLVDCSCRKPLGCSDSKS